MQIHKFIACITLALCIQSNAQDRSYPKPTYPIQVTIENKSVDFLGLPGSNPKSIVPIYSANCADEKCAAAVAAKKGKVSMLSQKDRAQGDEPSYILCEKLNGTLVKGKVVDRQRPSLFCRFSELNPQKTSYIDPFALWAMAIEKQK